jgi:endonuclease-3
MPRSGRVGKKGAVGHRAGLRIGWILREVRRMVYGSTDRRATALSELKRSEGSDPFKILIGTILSHRTRDENTTRAVENLFSRYRDAHELANADIDEVRRLIKPAGFYNVKARNIVLVARQIVDEFGGKVPSDIDSLLSLRSVGRKTANCVLVYGFGIPAIPVDTHVHRISNRLGIVETRTPAETEEALKKVVPKKYWLELNDLFVRFGQTTCRPVGPRCNVCSLAPRCRYYRETYLPSRKDR